MTRKQREQRRLNSETQKKEKMAKDSAKKSQNYTFDELLKKRYG